MSSPKQQIYRSDTDSSLAKYESGTTADYDNKPVQRRAFTFKSNVADSHAQTVAAIQAPEAPSSVNNWYVYFVAITVCFGAVAYGYDTGFFGGTIALASFRSDFGLRVPEDMTAKQRAATSANLVSLFQGGSFFGAALQLPVTNAFGRKWSIIISNIIFIGSALIQTFANGSVGIMMGGRFMGGFAIGISSLVIPIYLSEFAPATIRGRLVGFYDIGIQIGTLVGFWINYALAVTMAPSKFQWQLPVFVQLFPAAILAVGMFLVPETPRFLIEKGKHEQATKVLCRLRKLDESHPYLQWELRQTQAQAEAEALVRGNDSTFTLFKQLFKSRGHRYRLGLGIALIGLKTFSGVQAVNYYSPVIFEQLGFSGRTGALFATGIYGTVKAVCTLIFGLFIVDRIGRRRPLIFGSIGMVLCLWFIGGYLTGIGPRPTPAAGTEVLKTTGDYFAITALFLYAAIYNFGWNSVPLTLISEIFTMRFKTISMTLCLMAQWTFVFAIVRIMPVALNSITSRTYFIFASIFSVAPVFVYFLIPETTGLPLEAMDMLFGEVERTDAEKAVLGYGDATKDTATATHHEHSLYADAVAQVAHSNEVQVMAPISESHRH